MANLFKPEKNDIVINIEATTKNDEIINIEIRINDDTEMFLCIWNNSSVITF